MGGFEETLTAKLDGRGDWKAWNGNLTANLGAAPLARVALTARDGTFAAKGTAQASRMLAEGPAAELLGSETAIDLTARLGRHSAVYGKRVSGRGDPGVRRRLKT